MDFTVAHAMQLFVGNFRAELELVETNCIIGSHTQLYYLLLFVPSILTGLIFGALTKAENYSLEMHGKRLGLVYPMNIFSQTCRMPMCCAIAIATVTMYDILRDQRFFINEVYPLGLFKGAICIITTATAFFNVLMAFTIQTALSYAAGAIFIWGLTFLRISDTLTCMKSMQHSDLSFIIRVLPVTIGYLYLSARLPYDCIQGIRSKNFVKLNNVILFKTIDEIRDSKEGQHVRKLLKKPQQIMISDRKPPSSRQLAGQWSLSQYYRGASSFRYPTKLLAVMSTSILMVYSLTIDFMQMVVPALNNVHEKSLQSLEAIGFVQVEGENTNVTFTREGILLVFYLTQCTFYALMVSIPMSCVILFVSIIHSIITFRKNTLALFRADFSNIPSASVKKGSKLCSNALKYSGYQISFIIVGFVYLCVFLFFIFLTIIIVLMLIIGGYRIWLGYIKLFGSALLLCFITHLLQTLTCHSVFLQGDRRFLRLDNRRLYFVFDYYIFFFNVISGLISCFWRHVKALVISALILAKMDICLLPRSFDDADPGFSIYHGFLHLYTSHNNPVLLVFIGLLISLSRTRKLQEKTQTGSVIVKSMILHPNVDTNFISFEHVIIPNQRVDAVYSAARFNWLVTYTLINNPGIRIYRRGFIQLLNSAIKQGLKVPLSDRPIYYILTQIQNSQKHRKKMLAWQKEKHTKKVSVKKSKSAVKK